MPWSLAMLSSSWSMRPTVCIRLRRRKKFTASRRAMSVAEDDFALSLIRKLECPVILILNKMDAVPKKDLLPLIAHWSALYPFADVIPISARKKEGLELLLDKVVGQLKEGQRYFPKHQLTDQPERFLVAELIREKILLLTGEEVPYATAVVIERYEEPASTEENERRQITCDQDCGCNLLRTNGAESNPDRETRGDAEANRHSCKEGHRVPLGNTGLSRTVRKSTGRVAVESRFCRRTRLAKAIGADRRKTSGGVKVLATGNSFE